MNKHPVDILREIADQVPAVKRWIVKINPSKWYKMEKQFRDYMKNTTQPHPDQIAITEFIISGVTFVFIPDSRIDSITMEATV